MYDALYYEFTTSAIFLIIGDLAITPSYISCRPTSHSLGSMYEVSVFCLYYHIMSLFPSTATPCVNPKAWGAGAAEWGSSVHRLLRSAAGRLRSGTRRWIRQIPTYCCTGLPDAKILCYVFLLNEAHGHKEQLLASYDFKILWSISCCSFKNYLS